MASAETVVLNDAHPPKTRAIEAFNKALPKIKLAVISSRHDWDKHEPRMWSRARGLTDSELSDFVIENDLIEVRTGATSYGTINEGNRNADGQPTTFRAIQTRDTPLDYFNE
ncbi:hypothetical protein FRC06_006899 [Ceratobasidium sp. 370]|nr:hypothetical protein FRC06_006899 [Ceratobasidium sp. 370]